MTEIYKEIYRNLITEDDYLLLLNKSIIIEIENGDKRNLDEIIGNMKISYCFRVIFKLENDILNIDKSVFPYYYYLFFNDKNEIINYENNKCSFSLFPPNKTYWLIESFKSKENWTNEDKDETDKYKIELEYSISISESIYFKNKKDFRIIIDGKEI